MRHESVPMSRNAFNALAMVAFLFVVMLWNDAAFAAATKVGDSVSRVSNNISPTLNFINWIAFISGAMCVVVSLSKLKNHIIKPDQVPLSQGLWFMFGGGLLVSVPSVIGMLQRTLKLDSSQSVTVGATSFALSGGGVGLDGMMINFIKNVQQPMYFLLTVLGAALGAFFLVTGLLRMAKGATQDGPRGSLGAGTIGRIVIGAILLSFAPSIDMITSTLFGSGVVQFSGLNIPGVDAGALSQAKNAVGAVLTFIQIVGGIAFMRGFLMLRALADGGGGGVSTSAAFTHIIGGSAALNISTVLNLFQNTFCDGACSPLTFS